MFLLAKSVIQNILCQSLCYRLASSNFFLISHFYQQKLRIIDTQYIYNYFLHKLYISTAELIYSVPCEMYAKNRNF